MLKFVSSKQNIKTQVKNNCQLKFNANRIEVCILSSFRYSSIKKQTRLTAGFLSVTEVRLFFLLSTKCIFLILGIELQFIIDELDSFVRLLTKLPDSAIHSKILQCGPDNVRHWHH